MQLIRRVVLLFPPLHSFPLRGCKPSQKPSSLARLTTLAYRFPSSIPLSNPTQSDTSSSSPSVANHSFYFIFYRFSWTLSIPIPPRSPFANQLRNTTNQRSSPSKKRPKKREARAFNRRERKQLSSVSGCFSSYRNISGTTSQLTTLRPPQRPRTLAAVSSRFSRSLPIAHSPALIETIHDGFSTAKRSVA